MIVIRPHLACVNALAYSPDGQLLASVSEDGRLKMWAPAQLARQEPLWTAEEYGVVECHAQFTPDGRWLVTCGETGTIGIWAPHSGELVRQFGRPSGSGLLVGALVLSRDGRYLAFAGGHVGFPERIVVVRTSDWGTHRLLRGHDNAVGILAAGPDGLVSGGADRRMIFWDWETGRPYHEQKLRGWLRGLAWSPDGETLAAAGGTTIACWTVSRLPRARRPALGPGVVCRGHTKHVMCLDFSPDGRTLASASHDATLRLWNPETGTERRAFDPKLGRLHWVTFAPDGLTLAFSSNQGHLGVLDVAE